MLDHLEIFIGDKLEQLQEAEDSEEVKDILEDYLPQADNVVESFDKFLAWEEEFYAKRSQEKPKKFMLYSDSAQEVFEKFSEFLQLPKKSHELLGDLVTELVESFPKLPSDVYNNWVGMDTDKYYNDVRNIVELRYELLEKSDLNTKDIAKYAGMLDRLCDDVHASREQIVRTVSGTIFKD